jgi:glycosyltransferase involved in cell wall biosynthesis
MGVLQIVPADADYQTERGSGDLARRLGRDLDIQTRPLGRGPLRNLACGVLSLRREDPNRFQIAHAWGSAALSVAAMGTRLPILYTPTDASQRAIEWVRAVGAYRRVEVACPTSTSRRMHIERGVPAERVHLIRPGVDFGRVRGRRDPELRRRLELTHDDYVVLLSAESTRASGQYLGAWAVAMLLQLGLGYRLLIWGRGELVGAIRRVAEGSGSRELLRIAEERLGRMEFESLLPAADAMLVTPRGATPTLPIATAMAAAVPIISTVTYTAAELLEDRHTSLMVSAPEARLVARRIMDMRSDPQLQWAICDMARTEAYEFFSLTRFVDQYRAAYQALAAGRQVEIVQPAPGAGQRFHGRA